MGPGRWELGHRGHAFEGVVTFLDAMNTANKPREEMLICAPQDEDAVHHHERRCDDESSSHCNCRSEGGRSH